MNIDSVAAKRSRPHTRYVNKAGRPIPGCTTVLGVLAKPALYRWNNQMGLKGIDTIKYVDVLALAGTLAHEMILCHLLDKPFESDQPKDIIDKAENSFLSYLEWERKHTVEPILCEAALVSETHQFGGTIDFYGKIDGERALLDFKTAKAIYPEHLYQVSAYHTLLEENGYSVDNVGILQLGRSEDEGFIERVITDDSREWVIFQHALALYQLGVGK
jgi:hypothetical protein